MFKVLHTPYEIFNTFFFVEHMMTKEYPIDHQDLTLLTNYIFSLKYLHLISMMGVTVE